MNPFHEVLAGDERGRFRCLHCASSWFHESWCPCSPAVSRMRGDGQDSSLATVPDLQGAGVNRPDGVGWGTE